VLTHGHHHTHIELPIVAVMVAGEDSVSRNELRLRLARDRHDAFPADADHRMAVKLVAPPEGDDLPHAGGCDR
jgi:NADPH-dependent ferric siderophore reductase